MANIPKSPLEGSSSESTDTVPMLFACEDDGASGLRAVLFSAAYSIVTNAQRLGALCIGGAVAEDAAAAGFPVLTGGRYDSTPRDLDTGDVGAIALDADANTIIVGNAAEDAAALGGPVQVGGRYDATPRSLDDGDVGAVAIGGAGRVMVAQPTGVTTYNVTLTSADTEYSQALPSQCRAVSFRCRTAYDVRFAWVTGKVATPTAPYQTLKANAEYWKDSIHPTSLTLYLASAQAGVVVEIEAWS